MSLFMADSAFRETNDQSDHIVGIKNSNIIILQNSLLQFSCSFHLYSYISLKYAKSSENYFGRSDASLLTHCIGQNKTR